MIPTQADFEHDLTDRCREAVRATIQIVLDEELERLIGAGRYEHSDRPLLPYGPVPGLPSTRVSFDVAAWPNTSTPPFEYRATQ